MQKKFFLLIILFISICLAGCGGQDSGRDVDNSASPESSFDWQTQTFSIGGQIQDESALSVTDFQLWEHESPDSSAFTSDWFYSTDGTNFYTLVYDHQSENICLSIYDLSSGSQEQVMLPVDAWTDNPSSLYVTAASMLSPEEFAVQITSLTRNEEGSIYPEQYRVIRMNYQGEILSDADMLSLYESLDMISAGVRYSVADCLVDGDSCIYTRKDNSILITDSSGELLMTKTYGDRVMIGDPIRSDDGKLIFPIEDGMENTVRLVWFDAQNSKEYLLAELEYPTFQKLYAMRGRHIYYGTRGSGGSIIDWDTSSGNRSEIFRYKDNAILDTQNSMLAFDREGKLLLRVVYENEDMLFILGEQDDEREAVRIADLSGSYYSLLKSNMASFSRRNPLYHFSYEKSEAGLETAFRDRIMAELTSGTGPDILYLSREDLIILQEKGVLADLEEFLSQDTLQELLPGAVELGRVEGSLSGIPGEVYARTIFTYPDIWDADSWTISDILNLMQNRAQENSMEAILPATSDVQLYYLALLDLEHSAFIDWENNTCSFSTEEFTSLLKTIKTYSLNEVLVLDKDDEMLRDKKCLGILAYIDFGFYEKYHTDNGEDIKAVGFPSETGNGNYLMADGILAINAHSANKEAASAFLEYVLSIQGQRFCTEVSVRKNMLSEDMVVYDENNKAFWTEDGHTWHSMDTRKDGTVYIQQYNEFLESCVPYPDSHSEIVDIISEEAEAFFYGDKTAEQTAEIIDKRVQIYLDEHS